MTRLPSPVRQNNPAEWQAFHTTCERLAGFARHIDPEWVDGFLTALAAGPRLPEPQAWLSAMFDDDFERAFADPEDLKQALRSLQVRLKVLCDQLDPEVLLDDPDALRLDPLMMEWELPATPPGPAAADGAPPAEAAEASEASEAAKAPEAAPAPAPVSELAITPDKEPPPPVAAPVPYLTGMDWGLGFTDAVDSFSSLWERPQDEALGEVFDELMGRIAVLSLPPGHPELNAHLQHFYPESTPTREDLLTDGLYAVQDLRVLWVQAMPAPQTRRVAPTPGRNDPCPCGSGRKYKKCHGAPA